MSNLSCKTINDTEVMNNDEFKPNQDIQRLIDKLVPHSTVLVRQADHTLNSIEFDKRRCFLLHSGHVSLCRQSDGLVLNSERAPFVFGFSNVFHSTENLTVYPGPNAKLSVLPLEKAWSVVGQQKEWESLSKLLMYISLRIYAHCIRTSQFTSYGTIRALLLELYAEPEALRQQTAAVQYIQSRCHLSRSGIMYTLSQLRIGNYLTIKNGKLVDIHFLPLKF